MISLTKKAAFIWYFAYFFVPLQPKNQISDNLNHYSFGTFQLQKDCFIGAFLAYDHGKLCQPPAA
jgi:hypothetical protein